MNKILFDLSACQPNHESKFHGGGIYGKIVFKRLVELAPNHVIAFYFASRFLDPSIIELINKKNITFIDGDKTAFDDAYKKSNADIVYSPLFNLRHESVIRMGVNYVVTIHGLRSLEMLTDTMESDYATSFWMWIKAKLKGTLMHDRIFKRNYHRYGHLLEAENVDVVTVSNHSKYSIKCYYPQTDISKITVFYSPSTTIDNYTDYKTTSGDKYYLIISANRWLKNAGRAIKAFDMLFDTYPDLCSVVKVLGLRKNTAVYTNIRHKEKFQLLGYQTQENLETLYADAYAFIYPTLNEGFGYPPLEAMKYGVPVISSPFSSIPEICGDAVLYANPYSVEEIATRILQLEEKQVRELYCKRGLERYDLISRRQEMDLQGICQFLLDKSR